MTILNNIRNPDFFYGYSQFPVSHYVGGDSIVKIGCSANFNRPITKRQKVAKTTFQSLGLIFTATINHYCHHSFLTTPPSSGSNSYPESNTARSIAADTSSTVLLLAALSGLLTMRRNVVVLMPTFAANSVSLFAPRTTLASSICMGVSVFMEVIIAILGKNIYPNWEENTLKMGRFLSHKVIVFPCRFSNERAKKRPEGHHPFKPYLPTIHLWSEKMLTRHNISTANNAQDQASQDVRSMSSMEIAELAGKRHDNVMADVRKMLKELELHAPDFSGTQDYGNNNVRAIFNLPKDLTITLVSGYSVVMRHRIITRWQELEAAQAAPRELSRMDLIQIAMEAEQERLLLAAKVEEMQPTVAAYDRLASAVNTMTMTDAAKQLNMNPQKLVKWMASNNWIYKPQGNKKSWMAFQPRLDAGLMMHITDTVERDGQVSTYSRAHVTAKGLATISKQIEKARQTAMILGEAA